MNAILLTILNSLKKDEYMTANEIAEMNKIGEKTVRTRIKEMQNEVERNGAEIISKQRMGFLLKINDEKMFDNWKTKVEEELNKTLPNSSQERNEYILALLLNKRNYIKIEEISDFLCISSRTISQEMKKVEKTLNQYYIKIERKTGSGIRAVGEEFNFRQCLMDCLITFEGRSFDNLHHYTNLSEGIAKILLDVMKEKKLVLSDISFQDFVMYLAVTTKRINTGFYAEAQENLIKKVQNTEEFTIARYLLNAMQREGIGNNYSDDECYFACIYIMGKKIMGTDYAMTTNIVIPERVDKLVWDMFCRIQETYGFELRDNLNARMMFVSHMMALDIRMQYGIKQENPLVKEIKKKYPFAYAMAQCGVSSLYEYYGKVVSEDEISYFAELIELFMENRIVTHERKNLLLVCGTGRASTQFLKMRLTKEFGDFIKNLYTCNSFELDSFDMRDIDYIFTTVPINRHVNIPILEINQFMDKDEVLKVKGRLEMGETSYLRKVYRKSLFFRGIGGNTKEEVLFEICTKMKEQIYVPDTFYDSVMDRERLGSTDYGNMVAIPHPEKILLQYDLACVAILDRPIFWGRNMVQMVLLVSICNSLADDTQKFYHVTTDLLLNEKAVQQIIQGADYEEFMEMLEGKL